MIKSVKYKIHWGSKEGRFRNPLRITKTKGSLFRGDRLDITAKKVSLLDQKIRSGHPSV